MFLLKPHVVGPEGQITTPDVIVDRLIVDGKVQSTGLISQNCWQQAAQTSSNAAYAIMALGGGALILPVLVMADGPVIVARKAWRLMNLDGHIGRVTLNDVTFRDVGLPADMIGANGGAGDALPRGFLLIQTSDKNATTAVLADPVLNRDLAHQIHFEPLGADPWGDSRPRPRYSVGPTQKEVPHFI